MVLGQILHLTVGSTPIADACRRLREGALAGTATVKSCQRRAGCRKVRPRSREPYPNAIARRAFSLPYAKN